MAARSNSETPAVVEGQTFGRVTTYADAFPSAPPIGLIVRRTDEADAPYWWNGTDWVAIDAAEADSITARSIAFPMVAHLGSPIAADDDRIITDMVVADGAIVIAADVDTPRNLTITITDADSSISAGFIRLLGFDCSLRPIELDTPLAGGSRVITLTNIFAHVNEALISASAGATGADKVKVGVGNVIGLPTDAELLNPGAAFAFLGAAFVLPTALASGVGTTGVDASNGTYDGIKPLRVYYIIGA